MAESFSPFKTTQTLRTFVSFYDCRSICARDGDMRKEELGGGGWWMAVYMLSLLSLGQGVQFRFIFIHCNIFHK